ncbi:hypothetical protein ACFL4R_01050 [Nitrospirota bacterium]
MEELYMQARIKDFVQGMLGCQCPEEAFETIDCVENFTSADGSVVKARINVGNRLLTYVVEMNGRMGADYIRNLLREGMLERDRRGFNRFRLALCADDRERALSMLNEISSASDGNGSSMELTEGMDERVHAHILPSGSF